jgi:isoleucyl-tRNA synthetase
VLKTLAKILAPFAPFFAEDLYQKLKLDSDFESVHLEMWPQTSRKKGFFEVLGLPRLLMMQASARPSKNSFLLDAMEKTRKIVSLGLEARAKANIKVRQPLATLSIKKSLAVPEEFLILVKERVNVKSVAINDAIGNEVLLDATQTEELKEEGIVREIIRFVQDLRKKLGLTPSDKISLSISGNEMGKKIILNPEWQRMLSDAVQAEKINIEENSGEKLLVEENEFAFSVNKI